MRYATLRFRVNEPDYSDLLTKQYDWFSVYGEVTEMLPEDASEPLGKLVTLTHYVDANLLHDASVVGLSQEYCTC